jgi:curved DNA-binding protein CbpA
MEMMAEAYENPYAVLGLSRTASAEEIKQTYFGLVRQHPPEREPEAFKRIRAAYDRLRLPEQRVEADMRLLEAWPKPARAKRVPRPDLAIRPEDVLTLLKADSELGRVDPRADFREVHL